MFSILALSDSEPSKRAGAPPALRPASWFTCARSRDRAGAISIRLTGDLDMTATWRLEQALRDAQAEASEVVLDLRGLTFIDCSGMHVIVEAAERAQRAGHRLEVVPGPAQVDRVFTLTRTAAAIETAAVTG